MEYCAVQSPVDEVLAGEWRERCSVERHHDIVIAALHTGYCPKSHPGQGEEILKFRATNLTRCILSSRGYHEGNMESALESGFQEMDKLVLCTFGKNCLVKKHLVTKLNTVVVIVDVTGQMIYTAGLTGARVMVLPSSRMLSSRKPGLFHDPEAGQVGGHPVLTHFHQEALTKDDTYLVIASRMLLASLCRYCSPGLMQWAWWRLANPSLDGTKARVGR